MHRNSTSETPAIAGYAVLALIAIAIAIAGAFGLGRSIAVATSTGKMAIEGGEMAAAAALLKWISTRAEPLLARGPRSSMFYRLAAAPAMKTLLTLVVAVSMALAGYRGYALGSREAVTLDIGRQMGWLGEMGKELGVLKKAMAPIRQREYRTTSELIAAHQELKPHLKRWRVLHDRIQSGLGPIEATLRETHPPLTPQVAMFRLTREIVELDATLLGLIESEATAVEQMAGLHREQQMAFYKRAIDPLFAEESATDAKMQASLGRFTEFKRKLDRGPVE